MLVLVVMDVSASQLPRAGTAVLEVGCCWYLYACRRWRVDCWSGRD